MQTYRIGIQLLETGVEHVSPHLMWLIRNMIIDYLGTGVLNMICYRTFIPEKHFGLAHSPSSSITLNLMKHFDAVAEKIPEGNFKYTSLKCMLLKEILDTAAHEAHHIKISFETDNWENSSLEELEAKEQGNYLAWHVAKMYDVEIDKFGPVLDIAIEEFINDIKNKVQAAHEAHEQPEDWMELQIHMHDNRLAYYNPETKEHLSFRKAFEFGADDEDPWIDDVKTFINEIVEEGKEPTQIPTQIPSQMPEMAQQPIQQIQLNQASQNELETLATMTAPTGAPEDADMYDEYDYYNNQNTAPANNQQTTQTAPVAPVTQQEPQTNTAPITQNTQSNPNNYQQEQPMTDDEILKITEIVLKRLFNHVQAKCEFNTDGGYNNPWGVLDPVNIADIPRATELFIAMDTLDANGVWQEKIDANGQLRGLVSLDQRPRYTLYLNMRGNIQKRTFITSDPNKEDPKHPGQLSKWAKANKEGTRIMMFLEDIVGIRADVRLPAGSPFGQEEFKLWDVTKNASR